MGETKIKLDVKDKKILYELEKDARQSNRIIGKKVGVNPDLVRYRINKLIEKGVIDNFLTFVNFAKLGFTDFGIFVNTRGLTQEKEKEFTTYLKNHQNITYFAKVGGKYDFIIGILAKDILHFHTIISQIMNTYGDYISNKDISIRMALFHFSKDYLIGKKGIGGELPYFGGEIEKVDLDDIDRKILKILSQNARINIVEISEKIKIPLSTVALRIKKLQNNKIINGFFTWINPLKFGVDNYDVLISFKNVNKEIENKFYSFCKINEHISWLIKTVGKWDYEIGMEVPNKEKFQEVLSEIRENFSEYITNLDFIIIFQTLKYNLYPFE